MSDDEPIVLVDGDPIVYRCGFAGQHPVIHAVCEDEYGKPYRIRFEGKGDRNNYLKEHPGHDVMLEDEELEVEPLPFVLQTVKNCLSHLELMGNMRLFLTGKGNHRDAIGTVKQYKIGRKDAPRPVHYQAIREYMLTYKGAVLVNGREADDEISIRAARLRRAGSTYIVATIDKDLDQIPGPHYDYARQIEYTVTEDEGRRWFWQQVLSGDPTDSVPGCWKIGAGRAKERVDSWVEAGSSDADIWQAVINEYELSKAKKGCPYASMNSTTIALETARLVWMQTEPGALWNPPGTPFGRVEGAAQDD